MKAIRCAFAWLLPAIFSFSLIAPALLADSAPNVPACCRRDGKHHCAMMDSPGEPSSSTGPALNAVQQKCPLFPKGGAVPAASKIVFRKSPAVTAAPAPIYTPLPNPTETHVRAAFDRSEQKRGPPLHTS